ncbi:hypothetical protein A3K42_00755 [candidate division WWE3 bacterium RBG_13_37_7]|uniref:Histidine kinase N-terminal 7TM region domain-containing protein n=1 Tax=candidate division WWE3 bacterium RBG_13_37_7 TaxID=1802609 RepID=A0A1F4U2K1_UNCKA|nr:MAG: hypothetical protein A3K42_00755 [candidate division WWE3 bacterium RBG_13_37_7]
MKSPVFRPFRILLILVFVLYMLAWLYINFLVADKESMLFNYFTDSYGIIAAIGGIAGFFAAKKWGGIRSVVGRSVVYFSLGLFFQFLGQVSYAIYFYVYHIDNPYPSFGEVFYFGSIPIYIMAVLNLANAAGFKASFKGICNRIFAVLIPLGMMGVSYYLFLKDYVMDPSNMLVIFLDFGYPLGQAIFTALAIMAYLYSRETLGGVMKRYVIFILLSLVAQYVADSYFLVDTMRETWSAGGVSDLLFLISYFLMGLAVLKFGDISTKMKSPNLKVEGAAFTSTPSKGKKTTKNKK